MNDREIQKEIDSIYSEAYQRGGEVVAERARQLEILRHFRKRFPEIVNDSGAMESFEQLISRVGIGVSWQRYSQLAAQVRQEFRLTEHKKVWQLIN